MATLGLVVTFLGFLLAVASLGLTSSNILRFALVLAGMATSLGGVGVLNQAYMKHAIWKK